MKYFCTLSLLLFSFLIQSQNIVINELQSQNINTLQENCFRNKCPDWIELYNTSTSPIDIGNYFLSDDKDNLTKWQFPPGGILNPNSYLIVFMENATIEFSDATVSYKTNFNLSGGETLTLSDATETIIQQLELPTIQNDFSFGRLSDGNYSILSIPSPRAANLDSAAYNILDSDLTVSVPSGIYPSSLTVELSYSGPGSIFYTLDGSLPNTSSIPYTGSINISKNIVLKAIVIENANSFSIVENRSYIIGASHDLPIVLLTSDNSSRDSRDKESIDGRVEFNFIETDGTAVINQYANFRASGKTSRNLPQLNGKVEASKELYGDGDFDYKMYPYKDIEEFDSFLLRNASQDWSETHMRDALIARILGKDNLTDFPFEGYRPAVLYVNAKYQGIINIREDDDNAYIKHNFNLDKGEFIKGLGNTIRLDIPLPSNRNEVNQLINFNNFTNANFLIKYTQLNEFGFGWWEDLSKKTGQQYHYFMHDYDATFGLLGEDHVPLTGPMDVSAFLDREINNNVVYKNEALQFVAAAINHLYNTNRVIGILDEMESELENEIPAHALANSQLAIEQDYNRFNTPPFANLREWKSNVASLRRDILDRIDADIYNRIQAEYSLDTPIQVSYNSSNINEGFIKVHEIKVLEENASGTYFSNIPLKLSAEALPGFRFVRWEGDAVGTTTEIAPVFSTNASVTAIFEPINFTPNNIVINEVQSRNDVTIADENGEFDDWIEVYNPDNVPVNLANFYFSDNPSEPLKWQIPDTDPTKTTVPANGYLLLWADNDLSQGENHLGFRLGRTDEVLITYPDATTLKQRIDFVDVPRDASFGAETDASSSYIVFNAPTPNASNNGTVLSIESLNTNNGTSFSVYPNPTTATVTINTSKTNLNKPLNWNVFSITGSAVAAGKGDTINMENLASGLYFITINNGKTIKVVKE